ncbi:ATP-binding protein, partial [Arthrospira platensis SPKY2]
DRLFQHFIQLDDSNARRYGGTGLGLAISKQLAEMMDGAIGVTSDEGAGSEFWFTICLERQHPLSESEPDPLAQLQHARALVVDDNPVSRQSLAEHLTYWGMKAAQAADGPDGLRYLYQALAADEPFE